MEFWNISQRFSGSWSVILNGSETRCWNGGGNQSGSENWIRNQNGKRGERKSYILNWKS